LQKISGGAGEPEGAQVGKKKRGASDGDEVRLKPRLWRDCSREDSLEELPCGFGLWRGGGVPSKKEFQMNKEQRGRWEKGFLEMWEANYLGWGTASPSRAKQRIKERYSKRKDPHPPTNVGVGAEGRKNQRKRVKK